MSVPCSQAAEQVVQGEAQPAGAANPGDRNKAGVVSGEHSTFIVGGQPSEGEDRDGEQHSQAEERQKRGNEKSRRRGLSAKRLHISGSGQLPRLDTYLSELAARPSPSAVTQYLAEGLYKHHEPPQLPQRIQSFYLGPEARQPDLYSSTGFLHRPASACSSSSNPHLNTAPSAYAHVKPRIWSSRARDGSPQQPKQSQLLYGSTSSSRYSLQPLDSPHTPTDPSSSTAEPSSRASPPHLTRTSPPQRRSSPPRPSLPRPPRLGDPLSKSITAELQQQDRVLLRTAPQAAQPTPAHSRQQRLSLPQMPETQVSLKGTSPLPPTDKVAHAVLYGPPLASHPPLEPLKSSSPGPKPSPPTTTSNPTSIRGAGAGVQPTPAPVLHQAGRPSPAHTQKQQLTQHQVQRFVADVGRVMGRLQHTPARSPSGGQLEEGWGPEGKGAGANAKAQGLARMLQWQAAAVAAQQRQQRSFNVPLYTRVQLPASLQGVASASGKSGGAKLLRDLYEREGHTKSTIRKMLDQLPQLYRLEAPLLQALSEKFVPYSYPPNSLMVAQGAACKEVFILLSGQMLILPRAQGQRAGVAAPKGPTAAQPQPVCVLPGTVLGVDHMLQRLQAPNDVRSDPHFESHVATLKWEDYERELCNWAASKVLQHLPGLQFSLEAQLRTAILQQSMHAHRDAGTAVCTEGSEAEAVVLLVQGQILLTKQLQQDAILTEGQLMQHLRMTLGPSQDMVTLHTHNPSKGAAQGGTKRKSTGRSKAFQAALLRRQAMQVPAEDVTGQQASRDGFETVLEEGEEGEASRSPSPRHAGRHEEREAGKSSDAAGSQSAQVPEGSAGPTEHTRESSPVGADGGGEAGDAVRARSVEDGAGAGAPHVNERFHSAHEQRGCQEAQEQGQEQEQEGQQEKQQQQQQGQGLPRKQEQEIEETQGQLGMQDKPAGHSRPPLPPHHASREPPTPQPMPSLRSKLSGTQTPSFGSTHQLAPWGVSGGSQRSGSQTDAGSLPGSSRLASREAQSSHLGTPRRTFLRSGSGSGGGVAASPSQPVGSADAGQVGGRDDGVLRGHRRSSTHDGLLQLADRAGAGGAAPALQGSSSAADLGTAFRAAAIAPATPQRSGVKASEQEACSSGEGGAQQSEGNIEVSKAEALKQGTGVLGRQSGASREGQLSCAAGEYAGSSASPQREGSGSGPVADAEHPPSTAGGTGDEDSSESGVAVPEGLRGIPLLNALATMMKNHHQQVDAVFSQPVFMGTEALRASQDARVHNNTLLCLQSTECILIPWAALAAVLPKASLALLSKRMQSQARTIATTAGPSQGAKIERWPECADILREFLQTKPGARPVWQAENLADGFSSVKALAQLPWQARLRLFQGLKHMVVEQTEPALSLAISSIQEFAKPISGINLRVPQQQGTAGSTGNGADQVIQEGKEQGPHATPAGKEASPVGSVHEPQNEDVKAEVEEVPVEGEQEQEQEAVGERKLKTTVTGALRGISASVAEAEAAMARFQERALHGKHEEHGNSPGDPTRLTDNANGSLRVSIVEEALQTSDRASRGSLHVSIAGDALQASDKNSSGSSLAGHSAGNGEEAGLEQHQQEAHPGGPDEGAPLFRRKSILAGQLPPEARQLRSPESALSRLHAAAEAAELARLEAEEASEVAHLDAADVAGGRRIGGHAEEGHPDGCDSVAGRSSDEGASSERQLRPLSVNWEAHKVQGVAKGSGTGVPKLTALPRANHVPGTPDTDKLGSLKSWDGSFSLDSHPPRSGPCTPPALPQGTTGHFPVAYRPYDMDEKVDGREPVAAQPGKPPLPKAKSNRVEGQSLLFPGKLGPDLPEKPLTAPAAVGDNPAGDTSPSFGTPRPQSPPRDPTAAPPPGKEAAPGLQGAAESCAPVVYVHKKVLVLDPTPEQKDDQHYIILGGSVVLQAQPLTQEEMQAATSPPLQYHAAEQLAYRRRSAVRKQGPPPVVLATLGMGDAFNAKEAVELLRERITAAYAATAAAAAEGKEGKEGGAGAGASAGGAAGAAGSATSHEPHGLKHCHHHQQQQHAVLPLPCGPCRIVAVVVSPRVELLAMNAVLFGLVVGGAGRAMAKLEVQDVLKQAQSSWLGDLWEDSYSSKLVSSPRTLRAAGNPADAASRDILGWGSARQGGTGLSLGEVAKELMDACRIEDYKQGLELLRRGEASACVYVIVSGCCVLRSSYMGLSPDATANGVISMDLLKAKAGETVGELSMIASRPLWYSLVVASPSARVVAIDLQALRDFTSRHMPPEVLEKMLHRVAEKDLRLYATAIHTQALLIQQGKLVLDMFTPTMKTLLKQVLMLGPIGASGVQGSALEVMEAMAKGNQATSKQPGKRTIGGSAEQPVKGAKKAGGYEGGEEEDQLVAAAKEVGPIVIEHANEANQIVEHLSRPSAITAQANEKMSMAQWERAQKDKDQYLSSITGGSHVLQHSSFQLSTILHAAQNPFGSHDVLGELAEGARFEGWSSQRIDQNLRGPESVVHVCMPTGSAPKEDPSMTWPSHQPRLAHRTEHKTGPRAVTGMEVERRWDVPDGQAPSSVLSAEEVMSLIRARVHLKRTNLAAALAQAHPAVLQGDALTHTGPEDEQMNPDAPVAGHVWGEGDAGFWDDSRYVRELPERPEISTEGVGSWSLGLQQQQRIAEIQTSKASGVGRRSMGRRASVSIARGSVLSDENIADEPYIVSPRRSVRISTQGSRSRRLSIADQASEMKGSANDWSSKRRARTRHQSKVMAARSRGRVLQRRLTECAWDDSADALQELTARHEDGSLESKASSSSSTDVDPESEEQQQEDARLLQLQFSVLGQGKRDTSRGRSSQSRASADVRRESSFGVRRKSEALDDVSEGSEADGREEEARGTGSEHSQQLQQQQQQQQQQPSEEGAEQVGVSQQQPQPQGLSRAATLMRASMRRRPSNVQWNMDGRGGPDAFMLQPAALRPDVLSSLHPHPEGPEDRQHAEGEDARHPELQGVPDAILKALASEPPDREAPSIVHTFSMGLSARQAAEESLLSLGQRPAEEEGDEASPSSLASRPPGSHASYPLLAGAEDLDVAGSFESASNSSMGAGASEQPRSRTNMPGHGAEDKAAGTKRDKGREDANNIDLRERHFWVRDCLHDPSGITNPSMSLLMGEALAGALANPPTGPEPAEAFSASQGAGGAATAPKASPTPLVSSEASSVSLAAPSNISRHSRVDAPGAPRAMQADGATDWRVRVQMPPPRGSLHPPKMHGLPGMDDEDVLMHGSQRNPDKELLQQLWQEHHRAVADAREAERKRAIELQFEIAGPRGSNKGAPAKAASTDTEEQDSWEKQLEKAQTPVARQAVLKALLKHVNHPANQPSMPVKKSKPLAQPSQSAQPLDKDVQPSPTKEPSSPSKLPPASSTPAPLKDSPKKPAEPLKSGDPGRGGALQQPTGKSGGREVQQQQQQQQLRQKRRQVSGGQLMSEEAAGLGSLLQPQQQATALQAQHAALPSFSAKLMAKAHGRQRAATTAHGVHGRPASAVEHEGPGGFSLHAHQQQLRQQQQQLKHEAQGWWDASRYSSNNDAVPGALVAGTSSASLGGASGGTAAAGAAAGGSDEEGGQQPHLGRQHTQPGSVQVAAQGAGARRLEVDAQVLTEEDLAYVTVQVPPRTRITPEIDLSSHRPQQQAQKTQPVKYKRREPHVHMRAMMDKVSGPARSASGAIAKGEDNRSPAYVPTFLRSKRMSLAPETTRMQIEQEAWVVPQFSSNAGFEYGLYDVNNGITYFD